LGVGRPLLIHVRDTQRVQAVGAGGIRLPGRLFCGGRFVLPRTRDDVHAYRREKKHQRANSNHNSLPNYRVHEDLSSLSACNAAAADEFIRLNGILKFSRLSSARSTCFIAASSLEPLRA